MAQWVLGERRYIYTSVTAVTGTSITISGGSYEIFDASDASVVASGIATVSGQVVYCLWQPEDTGIYLAQIEYMVGSEIYKSNQVIEVKETM